VLVPTIAGVLPQSPTANNKESLEHGFARVSGIKAVDSSVVAATGTRPLSLEKELAEEATRRNLLLKPTPTIDTAQSKPEAAPKEEKKSEEKKPEKSKFTPLRDRRMVFTRSVRKETPEGVIYHVDLKERVDEFKKIGPVTVNVQGKTSWIERATQRDFSIGLSVGGLIVTTLITMNPALLAAAPLFPSLVVPLCGLIGAVSDYTRNTRELKEGVDIEPPKRFNRDAVKSALGFGFLAKFALLAVTIGAFALGISPFPVDGLQNVTNLGQAFANIGAIGNAIPAWIGWAALGAGGVIGAVKGSELGYARMHEEYQAAKLKHEHPEKSVSVTAEAGADVTQGLAAVGVTAVAVGAGGDLTSAFAAKLDLNGDQATTKSMQESKTQGFSFVKAVESRQSEPAMVTRNHSFVEEEQARRGVQSTRMEQQFTSEVRERNEGQALAGKFAEEVRRREAAALLNAGAGQAMA
jgi:hypothetical protein